ncbi:MAG: 4Fe-4S binding protein [Clostridia bacterium]
MADLKTTFCGFALDNPFILASGPLSYSAEGIIRATKAGAAAVVTKTIRTTAAINPKPHMVLSGKNSLINSEQWSDYPPERWIKEEIPRAKDAGVKCLIASIIAGNDDPDEFLSLAKPIEEAGADMIEAANSSYIEVGKLLDMVKPIKKELKIPVIVKISNNWKNAAELTERLAQSGFDAITVMDGMGPTTRFDLRTGKPLVGGYGGSGHITGSTIFPFALQLVRSIAFNYKNDIMGLGGITYPSDAMEMLMAGASACGVCSSVIINGVDYFSKLIEGLDKGLEKYGYNSVKEIIGKSLQYREVDFDYKSENFKFYPEKCSNCRRCVTVCAYCARTLELGFMHVNPIECRSCGLCFTACPTNAISML